MEVFRPQNVYADLRRGSTHEPQIMTLSETLDHALTQEYETLWGRKTSTGCPQPKD